MGVKRDYDRLRVEPCFPAAWKSAEVTRQFRGAVYHVIICNPDSVENGRTVITVDGKAIEGTLLPDFQDGKTHEVTVILK